MHPFLLIALLGAGQIRAGTPCTMEVTHDGPGQEVPTSHFAVTVDFDTVVKDSCALWTPSQLGATLPPGRWGVGLTVAFPADPSGSRIVLVTLGEEVRAQYVAPPPDADSITTLYWEFDVSTASVLRARVATTSETDLVLVGGWMRPRLFARRLDSPLLTAR